MIARVTIQSFGKDTLNVISPYGNHGMDCRNVFIRLIIEQSIEVFLYDDLLINCLNIHSGTLLQWHIIQ